MWQSFPHLSAFLLHSVLAKLATSSIRVRVVINWGDGASGSHNTSWVVDHIMQSSDKAS